MDSQASAEAPQRRRLNLKPRDESAASKAEAERKSSRSNPFGAAKPREQTLAAKQGKKEEDILKEELSKDKFSLRLTPDQNDEKQAAEMAVKEAQDELEAETETDKKDALKKEIAERQEKLNTLVAGFEKMAIEKAKSGGGMRPSERRAQQLQQQGSGGFPEGGGQGSYGQQGGGRGYGGPEPRGFDYGNARGRPGGNYDQPQGQYGGSRGGGGGYDSYSADAQPNGQSFGARGSGGFDNYNSRGGESGGRRGREEGGGFGGSGGGGGGGGYEASADSSPFTQDRY